MCLLEQNQVPSEVGHLEVGDPGLAAFLDDPPRVDIAWADPPYDIAPSKILSHLERSELLGDEGIFILEHATRMEAPETVGRWVRQNQRTYGDSRLSRYGCP